MSPNKNMEELLASARELPTELTYDEVEFLFLHPTPPPPAQPWWRGGYLKFLLMLTLIISLLGFLLPTQADVVDYQISAFPVQEETPALTEASTFLPAQPITELTLPSPNYPMPQVQPPARKTDPEPAAAPTRTNVLPTDSPASPATNDIKKADRGVMPPALFEGTYSTEKNGLALTFKASPDNASLNVLPMDLTKAEQRSLKQNEAASMTIKRAAGSLLLYRKGASRTFEFLPNSTYQQDFTGRGWGPEGVVNADGFFHVTRGKSGESKPIRVTDQLWFRYFATDINAKYINLLREYGYTDTDFDQLWKLANIGIEIGKLEEILSLSRQVLTDRAPLPELVTLYFHFDKLEDLHRSAKNISFTEFDVLKTDANVWKRLSKDDQPNASVSAADEAGTVRKQERDLNFSTKNPGTTSETIVYDGETEFELIGNFDFRINKDTTEQNIIVYGPEKLIEKLRRKSDYSRLRLVHKNKKQPLFLEFPRGSKLIQRPEKGVSIEVKTTRKPKN